MANQGPSYGLSRDLEIKNQKKFNIEEALEVLAWIEHVNRTPFVPTLATVTTSDQVSDLLKDGVALCLLMNRLMSSPSCSAVNFHKNPKMPFHKMENISLFLNACKNFGVSQISCFQTVDLYENKQPYKVVECLRSLAAVAQNKQIRGLCPSEINFPTWVVKLAENHPRNFPTEVIRQGQVCIPLQSGTNKCASQKGMTPYGLARQIKHQATESVNGTNGDSVLNGYGRKSSFN